MEVVRYNSDSKVKILEAALEVLRSEGTIMYPTETAYGLGADFYSPLAYNNVFAIKFRDKQKVLPVIMPDVTYAHTLVQFSPLAQRLAEEYWPGPLTLVLPFLYARQFPHHTDRYLALRISSHPLASELAHFFGHPLIATSANITSQQPSYSVEDFLDQTRNVKNKPDLIIDAGAIPKTPPSTIIRVEGDTATILRQGGIVVNLKDYV